MTDQKLPEELEEQAMLYALGILSPEEHQTFMRKRQGESLLLGETVSAYRTIVGALAESVAPVRVPSSLRERLVNRIALEANREAEQFELAANTLASGMSAVKPRDAVRYQLLSRIEGDSNVTDSTSPLRAMPAEVLGGEGLTQGRPLSQRAGVQPGWVRSCWTAISNFLRTLVIRSMIPRPSSDGLTFVKASEGTWREIAPGVMAKLLAFDPVSRRTTTLLRFLSGTSYAPHRHAAVEELYVLEGGCSIAGREMAVGDYHRAEAGTMHHDTSTEDGCLLLAISSPHNEMVRE